MDINRPRRTRSLDPVRSVAQTVTSTPALAPTGELAAPKPVFEYKKRQLRRRPKNLWMKRGIFAVAGLLLVIGLFLGTKTLLATSKIITRNNDGGAPALSGETDLTKLRGEGDGRINILLLGIGGPGHEAPYLSDTNIVVSIDPQTKDVAMLSIPRDLWVPIPNHGQAKINAANAYGEQDRAGSGPDLAKQTVSKLLDLPIHYYIRGDFSAFRQAVDSVGGVDITVAKAISDPYYPCDGNKGGYCPFYIKAGPQHMNGVTALKFSRSRETTSDFDRAARQQQVLLALRQKALDLSTLTNPAKISGLIDVVGDHVKTDLQLFEIKKLAEIIKDIDTTKVISKVLDTSPGGLLVDHSGDSRGYIELPRSGDFTEIRAYVHSIFIDGYLRQENARIDVQNGTTRPGLATQVGAMLKSYNYNVIGMETAPQQNYPKTLLYDYTGGKKPYTIQYLENRYGVKAVRATPVTGDPEIRLILGANYQAPKG